MSVQAYKSLARRHWEEYLPQKVADLKAEGKYNEALQGAASLAQAHVEHLMQHRGYSILEAEAEALPLFIRLKAEPPPEDDEQEQEHRELEAEYRRVYCQPEPEDEDDEPHQFLPSSPR
jgi:hypothetical protein